MPDAAQQPVKPQHVADLTGTMVGRFAIRARLGAGGMGEVYRADDTRLNRAVALKRLAPRLGADPHYRQRLLREAQYASGLSHQHIAGVYDVLETNDELFLVMEYVEGDTLRQRLREPLSVEQFLEIAVQCAAALVAAQERGVLHRDIKPENIMLTPAGQVKVLDFGVAKQLPRADDAATLETLGSTTGSLAGTPAYMAPEVLLDKPPDSRADIFSLGVVFYEALGGRHPFRSESFVATSDRILHEAPPPLGQLNPKVSAELERIVAKMLAKGPGERHATAADLLVDLRAEQRAAAYPAAPTPAGARVARAPAPRQKRYVVIAAMGAALVVAAGLLPQVRQRLNWFAPAPVEAGAKNLAVLAFQAIGGAPENQAYSDGLTETLTAKLTQLTATHNLQVVPAREVRARRVASAAEARKELGVSMVLEGTFDRAGNQVRINYALVDTRTLRQLRADTITAEASDVFAVQDRAAAGAVRLLELELNPQERRALSTHGTRVASANDFYLQGRGYLQNSDRPENIDNAISVFERALSLDPNYALAHAGLGDAYWKKYGAGNDTQWVEAARRACARALSLDPRLAAAHACLGTLHNGTGKYEHAVEEFRRALEAEPTSDAAYRGLALAYDRLNQFDQAEQTFRQAVALRPHYWAGYSWLGAFYFRQARYREAEEMFQQVVSLAPDSFLGYSSLGGIYTLQGRYADAIGVFERSVALRPTAGAYSNLATAYFYQRRFADAARTYEQGLKLDARNPLFWMNLGDAYYWAPGRRAQAGAAYEKAIALGQEKARVNPRDASLLRRLAYCYAMLGQRKPARENLERALGLAPENPEVAFYAALIYMQFGEAPRALAWLEKAAGAGYSPTTIRDTPNFDALRKQARFLKLLEKK